MRSGQVGIRSLAGAVVVVATAAVLRLWALDFGLPHLMTRPDEEVILVQTRSPATGTFDLAYGIYPSAYIFLSWGAGELGHATARLVGLHPPIDYAGAIDTMPWRVLLLLRLLSALAGITTVALLIRITRREIGSCAALIAGTLLAVSLIHVRDSHAAKPDVLMSLGVVAALGTMAPLGRGAARGRAVATGIVIGLAMGMKYPAVLLLVPAWVLCMVGSPRSGWRRLVPLPGFIVVAAAAVAFLITSPDLLLNPETRRKVLSIVVLVFPRAFPDVESPAASIPALLSSPDGFQHSQSALDGWRYYYGFALRYGMGLTAMALVPPALAWGFLARRPLALASALFATLSFLLFGLSPALLSRYLTPLVPAFAILLAGAVTALIRRSGWRHPALLLALITIALAAEPLWRSFEHDRLLGQTDTRVLATEWLRAHLPPQQRVAMAGTVFWGWGEPALPPGHAVVRGPLDPAALDDAGVGWIVAHDHSLFSSRLDPASLERLDGRLVLRAAFDPFRGARDHAVYDAQDAYYAPLGGFAAVERPGPSVRIYQFKPAPAAKLP